MVCKPRLPEVLFSTALLGSHQLTEIESWIAMFLDVYTNLNQLNNLSKLFLPSFEEFFLILVTFLT